MFRDMPPRKLLALAGRRNLPEAVRPSDEYVLHGELDSSLKPGIVAMMPAGLCATIAAWAEGRTCMMA